MNRFKLWLVRRALLRAWPIALKWDIVRLETAPVLWRAQVFNLFALLHFELTGEAIPADLSKVLMERMSVLDFELTEVAPEPDPRHGMLPAIWTHDTL